MDKIVSCNIIQNNIMATGTVKFFNESKGFGFITPSNGGKDLFVHVTGLSGQIREGDEVTFDVEEGKKGPGAVNVKLV
jgi:CspA family cold shock protein